MAQYKRYNGKNGLDAAHHTATGYRCLVKNISPEDVGKKIYFFAKHIIGKDGRPYTEIGFESEEVFNKRETMEATKLALINFGVKEVFAISSCKKGDLAFSQQATPYPNTIELRLHAGKEGVVVAFDALRDIMSQEVIDFIHEQESDIDNILFHSILDSMGDDFKKGPGGKDRAETKARELSQAFLSGLGD